VHLQSIQFGEQSGVLIALEDITSRKQAQRLLRRENERLEGRVQLTEEALNRSTEELQQLTARLFLAQEEERRRVARDLHDDFTQKLALLEMNVEQLEQTWPMDDATRKRLADIRSQTSEVLDGLRRVAHQMHPQLLEDLGLAVALERLTQEFEQHDMPVRFTVHSVPGNVPGIIATNLYRVAQEALHNTAKHANGAPVEVILTGSGAMLQLRVQDGGPGFDLAEARLQGGVGLLSMQERMRLIGGTLAIQSEAGEGTTVEATVPLAPESGE
jgi:two-component system CheB/CheR fusion protein